MDEPTYQTQTQTQPQPGAKTDLPPPPSLTDPQGGYNPGATYTPYSTAYGQGSYRSTAYDAPKPRRGVAAIVIAALIGGATGGLVSYKVASDVADNSGRPSSGIFPINQPTTGKPRPAEGSVAAIVEDVRPSIVAIRTETGGRDFFDIQPREGAGTGIIINADGHILTNNHVIGGSRSKIEVILIDGRKLPARVLGTDEATDLAVIKIEADNLKPAPLGDSDQLNVGDRVIAVGHALALPGGPTVTDGIVSAIDRSIQEENGVTLENLIQTDAAINPGNSGGALLDNQGRVVGVNTAIASSAQNIGFAIAITPAKQIVNQLIASGKVTRAFLGVFMGDNSPEVAAELELSVKTGAVIREIVVGSPAEQAGLRINDVILEIDGKKVETASQAKQILGSAKPGQSVEMVVARGKDQVRLRATLVERKGD